MIRILAVGDIMGKVGRRLLARHLEPLIDGERIDFVVVNLENAAGGFGLTGPVMEELDALPVDVWTSGNHVWDKKSGIPLLDSVPHLLRPANYPDGNPGRGWVVGETAGGCPVAVVNLQGQVMMPPVNNAFHTADAVLDQIREQHPAVRLIVVDIHAEATSEKWAMGRYLDSRATAVLGTHTHVPTADERVLTGGTAFQTDLGMTGPYDSIIGMKPKSVLERFLLNTPRSFDVAKRGGELHGALIEADPDTGRASSIRRVEIVDEA